MGLDRFPEQDSNEGVRESFSFLKTRKETGEPIMLDFSLSL
jgi:hypothetical protein